MTNEMALGSTGSWEQMKEQAGILIKSGFMPPSVRTAEQALAIGLAGKELGIGFTEAVRSINVIQGKVAISPQLMLALANRKGVIEDIKFDSNDERCIVTITRKGRSPHTETFGVKEATDLGLMGKDNYKKQRATMLKWRCLAACLRVVCPDVLLGAYTPEEMGAEVTVGENESMEVTRLPDEGEEVNIGKRVPSGYWDLRDSDPDKAQELLGGSEYYAKKGEYEGKKGWWIMTRDKAEEFSFPGPLKNDQESPKANDSSFITPEEQGQLFALLKEKEVPLEAFKSFVTNDLGAKGSKTIKKGDYKKAYEWILRESSLAIGHE